MSTSEVSSKSALFSAIYIEDAARDYPVTRAVLEKFPGLPRIPVRRYRDVFNRPRQNLLWQKDHRALILAVKEPPFLYPGPEVCQDFGADKFFYTSFLLGCPFRCDYCYLQGMYPSSYVTAFVNLEDFKGAIDDELARAPRENLYLALSYDTDLIAFDPVFPYLEELYPFFAAKKNLTAELRTKSANTAFFARYPASGPLVAAFSLAPDEVIRRTEKFTPSLDARLRTIRAAQDAGYSVRLCFDPVFVGAEYDALYEPFFETVFSRIDPEKVSAVSHGFFRMNRTFFRRIRKERPDSPLYLTDFPKSEDIVTYDEQLAGAVRERHLAVLSRYIPKERIFIV